MNASLLFHGELGGLLRRRSERGLIRYPVDRAASLKDVAEACGVTHTEIDRILVDGRAVDFSAGLAPGERVEFFPPCPPLDPTRKHPLRPPLSRLSFLADVNVGKLASLLRLLGQDCAAAGEGEDDAEIARRAAEEGRVLLTRDRRLLRRRVVEHGRLVRCNDPRGQLGEVLRLYGLKPPFALFSRCLRCNEPLDPVAKADVLERLEPRTRLYYDDFHRCGSCGRVYWRGSHHDGMRRMLETWGVLPEGGAGVSR